MREAALYGHLGPPSRRQGALQDFPGPSRSHNRTRRLCGHTGRPGLRRRAASAANHIVRRSRMSAYVRRTSPVRGMCVRIPRTGSGIPAND